MERSPDYAALGFKAGLEIHQQLDTRKLFCRCPSRLEESDEAHVTFLRQLKPTASELGEVDPAAVEEARKALLFEYIASRDSSCLVEMDEEPPHSITPEALDVALQVTLLLKARPVDELHIMRKIVVDGSNTGGFQRTALLATEGVVESEIGPSRIATLCLEEDSARRLDRKGNLQRFKLDRLGIPLVEIATEPDLKSPQHAREIAEAIGQALRATGRVKRGIGTIRQDLNVSIREGARVEMKGVQELRLIAPAIEWEVQRQVNLLEVRKALTQRGASAADYAGSLLDVTSVFDAEWLAKKGGHGSNAAAAASTPSTAAAVGGYAIALPHMAGLIGKKTEATLMPPPRVGRELADYAKVRAGVKGIFHSDELPAYGVTAEACAEVARLLNLKPNDAFAIVLAPKAQAEIALRAVLDRAAMLLRGVPEETRDVEPDGTSRYLRPLPGGARMYPETDVPPVTIDQAMLATIKLPEMPAQKLARFAREYPDLGAEQGKQVIRLGHANEFEELVKATGLVKEAARLLLSTLPELGVDDAPEGVLLDALVTVRDGAFAKEALPQVLKTMIEKKVDARAAVAALGLGGVDDGEIVRAIDELIASKQDLVRKQRERSAGAIMGPIMTKFRGKTSGETISRLVQERLAAWLAKTQP